MALPLVLAPIASAAEVKVAASLAVTVTSPAVAVTFEPEMMCASTELAIELIVSPPAPPAASVLAPPAAPTPTSRGVETASRLTNPVAAVTVDLEMLAATPLLMRL